MDNYGVQVGRLYEAKGFRASLKRQFPVFRTYNSTETRERRCIIKTFIIAFPLSDLIIYIILFSVFVENIHFGSKRNNSCHF